MLVAGVFAVVSCSSPSLDSVRGSYRAGDYAAARDELARIAAEDRGNASLYALERGMVELALGDAETAVREWRRARDQLDEQAGIDVTERITSFLTDDRQLDFEAFDYEQVLVRAMLAVAELAASGVGLTSDANAFALQVLERQQKIVRSFDGVLEQEHNPKLQYKQVVFGSYLRAILHEDRPLDLEVAEAAYARCLELDPGLEGVAVDLERVRHGTHSAPGNGVVHVLALLGRAPERVEMHDYASTEALSIAKLLWSMIRGKVALPEVGAVPYPGLQLQSGNPGALRVRVNSRAVADTEVITDVEKTALVEFDAMQDHLLARAIVRRALKIATIEGSKELIDYDEDRPWASFLGELAVSVGGLIWTGTEGADLRCWGLLPARLAAARIELPVGVHRFEFVPLGDGVVGTGLPQSVDVVVRDGRNSYVVVLTPTLQGGPSPLTAATPGERDAAPNPSNETGEPIAETEENAQ